MSKSDVRNAVLFGSYISASELDVDSFVLELTESGPDTLAFSKAAEGLIADGLITPLESFVSGQTIDIDRMRCPYTITPKGRGLLDEMGPDSLGMAALGFINIGFAWGGGSVRFHDERNTVSNVITFEQNMIKRIENSNASDQDKQSAKSKLQEFLAHPLLSSAVGAILGATLKT